MSNDLFQPTTIPAASFIRIKTKRLSVIAILSIAYSLILIVAGNAQTACTIPGGNAQFLASCQNVNTITGTQYNNGSLALLPGSVIAVSSNGPLNAQAINISFGTGFVNYSFSNYGVIGTNPLDPTGAPPNAVNISGPGSMAYIENFGTITADSPQGGDGFTAVSLTNSLSIDNFTNAANSSISANWGGGIRPKATIIGVNVQDSTINQFTNNGIIEALSTNLICPSCLAGIMVSGSNITTLTNTNSITAGIELNQASYIASLNNTGQQAVINDGINIKDSQSSIQTIINTGSVVSISNGGSIGTLYNYQGASGSGGKSLVISGNLPSVYNVIVSGNYYGQLDGSENPIAGMMQFGVSLSNTSNPQLGTYDSVLIGIPSSQISNFGNPMTVTGGASGYTYQYGLVQGDATATGASTIDLSILSSINQSQPYWLASSIGLFSNPNATTFPLFEGGTLRLSENNANYSIAFSVSSNSANTIDAAGLSSTFSGSFSNVSGQTGILNIVDSVGNGMVNFSGTSSFTGALNINAGASFTLNGTGSLAAPINIAENAFFQNYGTITGAISNSGAFVNENSSAGSAATLSGTVTNNLGGVIANYGQITGDVSNSYIFYNYASGTIYGTVTNNTSSVITNYGILQNSMANGGLATNYGTLSSSLTNTGTFNNYGFINGPITNTGTFTNNGTIGSSISAPVAINNQGTLVNVGNQTVFGNISNNGSIKLLTAGDKLTVNGSYAQSATGSFTTVIASETNFGRLESTQPLNIANGSAIVATIDPRLRIGPGTVFQGVHKGTGTPVETEIKVYTDRPRYKLKAVWSGPDVNLEWASTYYGALSDQTLSSVAPLQGPTLNALHQRYAVLNAVMEYDCNKFDKHNFCISAQARATGFGTQTTGAGVFNIAHRPTEQTRVGAFLDYQVAAGNPITDPSAVGAGVVNSGSVNYGYNSATFGGYLGFSETGYSEHIVNRGLQAFVSGGFNPGKLQTTRALMLDPYGLDFVDSQPGTGTASLNAYYARGMLGYGVGLTERATLMPYLGVRYTDVSRGGYVEKYNSVVTQPLVFNAFYERLVTGFGGMMLNGQVTDRFGVLAGLGAELDFSRSASSFSGFSPLPIQDSLFAFGFLHGGAWNGFRPTGTIGAYYDVMPNHRVSLNGYAGQQAFTTRTFTSTMLGYQIAF
jgi:hypothetical protein